MAVTHIEQAVLFNYISERNHYYSVVHIHLVPVLRLVRYAQLQQHQLLMLADALSDTVVNTLASGSWVLELNIVVTAGRPNHCKPAAPWQLVWLLRTAWSPALANDEGSTVTRRCEVWQLIRDV